MRSTSLFTIALALTLALAGCVGSKNAPTPAGNNSTSTNDNMTGMPMTFTVTVGGGVCPPSPPPVQPGSTSVYTLAPAKLQFTVGMKVNLTLRNDGCAPHDLVIDGIEGAKIGNVAPGKTASIEFTPAKAGTFPMYCTLGGGPTAPATAHKDHGMSGSVTVG